MSKYTITKEDTELETPCVSRLDILENLDTLITASNNQEVEEILS